jgi:hypothetical protein
VSHRQRPTATLLWEALDAYWHPQKSGPIVINNKLKSGSQQLHSEHRWLSLLSSFSDANSHSFASMFIALTQR